MLPECRGQDREGEIVQTVAQQRLCHRESRCHQDNGGRRTRVQMEREQDAKREREREESETSSQTLCASWNSP